MLVLGLSASPRRGGNSEHLLSLFVREVESRGAQVHLIRGAVDTYEPCMGCGYCEKKGRCAIKDSLEKDLFPLIRRADVMVLATPVYFYAIPGRTKGIIDRIQTLWSRKYALGLEDPRTGFRKGVLLAVGASRGKNLFDGIRLTTRYFFDAAGFPLSESLCYPGMDARDALKALDRVDDDVKQVVHRVMSPLEKRRKILFACRENAGRSQMAAGFARQLAGDRYDVYSAGSAPAEFIHPLAVEAMAKKGIDIAFNTPSTMDAALAEAGTFEMIVTMGCGEACPVIPGCRVVAWDIPDPAGQPLETVERIRDEICDKVTALVTS